MEQRCKHVLKYFSYAVTPEKYQLHWHLAIFFPGRHIAKLRTWALPVPVQIGRLIYSLCLSCRWKDHWASSPLHNGIRISGILSWDHCVSSKCYSSALSSWPWSLTHSFSNFVYGYLQGIPWSCTDWSSGGWLPSQPSANITPTYKTG